MALCRIAVGAAALGTGIMAYRMLPLFFELNQLVSARLLPWMPQLSSEHARWFAVCWMAASLLFLLGAFTRLSGSVLTLLVAYLLVWDQNLYSNHLYLLALWCLLLTIADSGAVLSLDWLRAGRPERQVYLWPLILIMLQTSLMYEFAGLQKINATFLSGQVLEHRLRVPIYLKQPPVSQVLAWLTVAVELFLGAGLWFRRLRPWAYLLGLAFHLSIALLIAHRGGLAVFAVLSLAPYLLFLSYGLPSRTVRWDERSGFQHQFVTCLKRLDWLKLHRFSKVQDMGEPGGPNDVALEPVEGEGVVVLDGERRFVGFDAVQRMLELLPVSFLWAVSLRVPPISGLAAALYRRLAGSSEHQPA